MLNKVSLSLLSLLFTLLAAGCWDSVEIEDRGFVVGVAIDKAKNKDIKNKSKGRPKGKERYLVTYQFAIPAGLGGGKAEGGSGTKAYFNLTSEGYAMMEVNKILASRSSRSPFMEHLQLIVISDEIVKESRRFQDILDFYIRHPEMRRGTYLAITKGSAKDVLVVENPSEKLPVMYLISLMNNYRETGTMHEPVIIGDIHAHLLSGSGYVIPRLMVQPTEVKSAGAAAFRGFDNRLAGWLDEEETEGLNFLTGQMKGGITIARFGDNLVLYEITRAKREIKVDTSDQHRLKVTFEVKTEGMIHETLEMEDLLKLATIEHIQKQVDKEIVRICTDTIEKLQKDFKVDVLGLGKHLSGDHPRLWEKIKNDWDRGNHLFSDVKIEVKSNAIIRNAGIVNQTEKQLD